VTKAEKKTLLMRNSALWIAAMVLPGVFSIAFASASFPWPVIIPCLLFGCLLASNGFIAKAIGEPTGADLEKAASEKRKLLMWNSVLWVAAMVVPIVFSIAFASTRFPWPVIVPCLLLGCLLASNGYIAKAIGEPTDHSAIERAT
jgi:fatty acid desaturase